MRRHIDVAKALYNVALTHSHQGNLAIAVATYERALVMYDEISGPSHRSELALVLDDLARTLWHMHQGGPGATRSRPLWERALAIQESVLGPHHPDLARTLQGLAGVLMAEGQQARAKSLTKRAVAISEASRPHHHVSSDAQRSLATIKATQKCAECNQHRAALKKCARCQAVYYCSVDCQV